ncbi:MAG: hypothetical protein RLY31_2805 [Bacteroidota bacterium]|jgi:hypothetical protein
MDDRPDVLPLALPRIYQPTVGIYRVIQGRPNVGKTLYWPCVVRRAIVPIRLYMLQSDGVMQTP